MSPKTYGHQGIFSGLLESYAHSESVWKWSSAGAGPGGMCWVLQQYFTACEQNNQIECSVFNTLICALHPKNVLLEYLSIFIARGVARPNTLLKQTFFEI